MGQRLAMNAHPPERVPLAQIEFFAVGRVAVVVAQGEHSSGREAYASGPATVPGVEWRCEVPPVARTAAVCQIRLPGRATGDAVRTDEEIWALRLFGVLVSAVCPGDSLEV